MRNTDEESYNSCCYMYSGTMVPRYQVPYRPA